MSLADKLHRAEEEHGLNTGKSEYWELAEGDNPVRIIAEPEIIVTHYLKAEKKYKTCYGMHRGCPYHGVDPETGKDYDRPSVKWLTWVIDRKDNKLKIAKLPHTVFKILSDYQAKSEYGFDQFPMPYDITITANGAGTKEVDYGLIPARANTDLTEAEQTEVRKISRPAAIVEKMKAKQAKENGHDYEIQVEDDVQLDEGEGEINPDDIPFEDN